VAQLRAASKRSVFSALAQPEAVGRVEASRVRLRRVIPMISNGFKPCFIGRFESRPDGVHLVGRFTLPPSIKIFLALWLSLALLIAVVAAIAGLRSDRWRAAELAGVLLVPALGLAIAAGARWLARGDVAWLSSLIRNALGSPAPLESQIETVVIDQHALPVTLKLMSALLAIAGVSNLLLYRWGLQWASLPLANPVLLKALDALLGLALLGLALGVYRRRVIAWRLGLAFLVLGTLTGVLGLWLRLPFSLPVPLRILQCLMFLAIYVFWARWWHAQRVHFSRPPADYPGV
jgi:hypothetical protein